MKTRYSNRNRADGYRRRARKERQRAEAARALGKIYDAATHVDRARAWEAKADAADAAEEEYEESFYRDAAGYRDRDLEAVTGDTVPVKGWY